MDKMTVIRRKEIRGKLVIALYRQYGNPIQVGSLINALARELLNAVDIEVPNQLYYLADKGFVRITTGDNEPALTPARDAYVQLTATGINLVERDIEDLGIIFGDGQLT